MCRSYESAVHGSRTPHTVPLTLQVIVSDAYQQIANRVAAERVAGANEFERCKRAGSERGTRLTSGLPSFQAAEPLPADLPVTRTVV